MNDKELDELLNTWKTPQPGESLRRRLRAAVVAQSERPRRSWMIRWRWAAATAAGLVLAVVLVNPAFSWRWEVPFTVDSEIRHFQVENMESVATPESKVSRNFVPPEPVSLVTSYNEGGSEVLLSASIPNQTLKTILGRIMMTSWSVAEGFKRRFLLDPDDEAASFAVVYVSSPFDPQVLGRRDELLSSGCRTSHGDAKVIGQDVVLNYPVTVVQEPHQGGNQMATIWMAPELSCFALRVTVHAKQTDGTWKLMIEKRAVKVEKKGQRAIN